MKFHYGKAILKYLIYSLYGSNKINCTIFSSFFHDSNIPFQSGLENSTGKTKHTLCFKAIFHFCFIIESPRKTISNDSGIDLNRVEDSSKVYSTKTSLFLFNHFVMIHEYHEALTWRCELYSTLFNLSISRDKQKPS